MAERYITRSAVDVVWESSLGDKGGFHYSPSGRSEEGQRVRKEEARGTSNRMLYEGRVWYVADVERPTTGSAVSLDDVMVPPTRPLDFTSAGVAPYWLPFFHRTVLGVDAQNDYKHFASAAFSSVRNGGIETIVAEFDGRRLEWDLDHSRGGQPVRATYYQGDKLVYESLTELTQTDGRWFPSRIEFYQLDEAAPRHVIEVQRATFDEPWHMQEIRPEDIGVLWGTQLLVPDAPRPTHDWYDGCMRWDGSRLISGEEYGILRDIYGIDPDPRITKMLAEPQMSVEEYQELIERGRAAAREKYYQDHGQAPWLVQRWKERDEWDVYVEEFIKKHAIDGARVDRAKYLLRRAKQLRDYQKGKTDDRITQARRANEYAKVAHFQEAGEKRTQAIFDQLVRGLEALVPKEDRKADARPDAEPPE
jgi:hypothetical protein